MLFVTKTGRRLEVEYTFYPSEQGSADEVGVEAVWDTEGRDVKRKLDPVTFSLIINACKRDNREEVARAYARLIAAADRRRQLGR